MSSASRVPEACAKNACGIGREDPAGLVHDAVDRAPVAGQRHDHVGAGLVGAGDQRRQPARRAQHVVVEKHDELAGRRGEADVARLVRAEEAVELDVAEAVRRRFGVDMRRQTLPAARPLT